MVIAHKNFVKGGAKVLSTAEKDRLQIFYVKTNSMAQIQKIIKQALDVAELNEKQSFYDVTESALDETKAAIEKILSGDVKDIELKPQNQQIRKLQHELAEQHNLDSTSIGEGENRRLRLRIVGGTDFENK